MTSLLLLWAVVGGAQATWAPYFDQAAFDAAQRAGRVIVLQFTDDGCPRCVDQEKLLAKRLAGPERKEWAGFQVSVSRDPAVARQWRVASPSTLVLLRGSRELSRSTGVIVETELDAFLRKGDLPEPHGRAPARPKLQWPPRP